MGVSLSTHFGPFIACAPKTINVPKVKRACPNHRGTKLTNEKFCPTCGTEVQNSEYIEKEALSMNKVLYRHSKFVDHLFSPSDAGELLLPNEYPPNKIKLDTYRGGEVDLTTTDLNELRDLQLTWFEEKYKEELEILRKEFPELQVKWGIQAYWS